MESKTFVSYGYVRFLLTLILVAILVALGAYAHYTFKQAQYLYNSPTMISVTGVGEVFAKTDIGQFAFSVYAEGNDATEAQNKSTQSIKSILEYLESQGVEEDDIKTTYYNLNPRYRYEERICPIGSYCPPGEQIMDGFEVSQSVSVKVRDLEEAGTLISGVGERGATNISNLSFTIDDEEVLKVEAREKAIIDAKEKAQKLAADLGVRVVRMREFWEDNDGYYPYNSYGFGGADVAFESREAFAAEVPAGVNTIMSRVTITYEME